MNAVLMKSEGGNGPVELAATSPDGEGANSHGAGQTPADEVLVSLCVLAGGFFYGHVTVSAAHKRISIRSIYVLMQYCNCKRRGEDEKIIYF